MRKRFLLAIAVLLPVAAAAQQRGTVYLDANRNGQRDGGEKGIAGVSVSDGRNVVKTAADGSFELPKADFPARFVTVTTPSGYAPAEAHYLPVVAETASYDFGLVRNGHTGAFEFIQITDTETPTPKEWIDDLKAYVAANPTAFIVHTGDICYRPGLDFHAANVRTRHLGVPTYYTIGNHDLLSGDCGEQHFEHFFGPVWYSFEVGNVHFLALPMLGGDHAPSYDKKQVLEWIRNDLAQTDPNKTVILFNHELWFQGDDVVIRAGGDSLDMKRHNLEAFIYGHWHSQYARAIDGVMTYCSSTPDKGGIDHSPACFRVFSVDADGRISDKTQARYTNIPGLLTTALPAQHDTIAAVGGVIPVRVNAYRTVSPVRSVRVALIENGRRGRMVSLAPQTDWNWSVRLAVGGRTGVQHLVAEATFADGTQLVEHSSFVLTDAPATVKVGGEWGNLGGDAAHAGVAAAGRTATYAPRYVWAQNAGGNIYMVSPVVGDGRVFVATIDDDNLKKCAVVAYDAVSGRELWRFRTGNSVKGTIVYSDGLVLACDAEMRVYAIDAATGRSVWDRQLSRAVLPENLHGLAVADGVVYAGQGSDFAALWVKDGSVVWKNEAWGGGEGTQSTTTVGEGTVLVSSHWNGLFAHDRQDGRLLWKKQDSKIRFRDGSATIYDGHIYLASRDELFLINPRSGDILKSAVQSGITFEGACAPVVTDRMVYVGTADRGVVAFDRRTFKPVWTYLTRPAIFYSVPYYQDFQSSVETSPVLIGTTLVFGASDGFLYGVDAENGRFRWKRNLGTPIFSSPAVSGDALYVADFSGNLYCLKIDE